MYGRVRVRNRAVNPFTGSRTRASGHHLPVDAAQHSCRALHPLTRGRHCRAADVTSLAT